MPRKLLITSKSKLDLFGRFSQNLFCRTDKLVIIALGFLLSKGNWNKETKRGRPCQKIMTKLVSEK